MNRKQSRKMTTNELRGMVSFELAKLQLEQKRLEQNMAFLDDALSYLVAQSGINFKELREKFVVIKDQDGKLILEERNEAK